LGLYVAQADDIRDLLDRLAPHTSGNLQTRIEQALIAQPADSAMEVLRQARDALRGAETWLEGWASAEPYLSEIRRALAAFDALEKP
jgi:hypothetical protein